MIKDHYEIIRKNKIAFWWFKGRRDFFLELMGRNISGTRELGIDAGCGPFTNDALYDGFARRWLAIDHSPESFREASDGEAVRPVIGDLGRLPVKSGSADIVLLLDVLEHTDDDRGVLSGLMGILKSGGYMLVSVPAFNCLWSRHDEQAGHKRRYGKKELEALCREIGFTVVGSHHFNSSLFLPIYLARKVLKAIPSGKDVLEVNLSPSFADPLLYFLLKVEKFVNFNIARIPFGTSAVLLLRKKDG